MNEIIKRYKILAIIFSVMATVIIVAHFILETVSHQYATVGLPVIGGIIAVAAVICWILYGIEMKKISGKQRTDRQSEEVFGEWLNEFEPLTKIAAELVYAEPGSGKFSKFGGAPVVPNEFEWPTENGRPIPFLLQLDFSEINPHGSLKNFPTSGLLYVFVEEVVNDENEIGHTKKFLFFESAKALVCAKEPHGLQTKYKEIFVASNYIKTYPDTDDCDEALNIFCARPHGGMDDSYHSLCCENMERHLVGGWPSHLQNGGFMKECMESDDGNWVLFLQIKSEYSKDGVGDFMWGDSGVIYLYICEKDLIARNFDNVKLDMQCY